MTLGALMLPSYRHETTDILVPIVVPAILPVSIDTGALAELPALPYKAAEPGANYYAPGNCTWYVADKRYVPGGLGDARTWFDRASARGMPVGERPVAGAIAWREPGRTLGHVAYVERVNADGSFTLSEMNYRGLYKISQRTVSAEGWKFIY